ncbi:hypothetical protein O4J56_07460 [Nocardiopsis sp. RSe5-2]|uniref:PQQ-binding-like beta-propeller repeat protein n=1 Tax=Nocardiopsis endophytica TaxID=3018445 RepID=A0ABT4U1W0_9ACTN|nr:hypothetical protein [Nocardiopsis endophytica]MDA2810470.1 hypothetical protein [Nocardiopsis endophytica]
MYVFDGGEAETVHVGQEQEALPDEPDEAPEYEYYEYLEGPGEWDHPVVDGTLYLIASDTRRIWDRTAAVDLTTGQTRWARYAEGYVPREVLAVEDGRVLVLALHAPGASSTPMSEDEGVDLRLLAFPADGEGAAEVVADGLPRLFDTFADEARVSVSDGRYYLALPPRLLGKRTDDGERVRPLYAIG